METYYNRNMHLDFLPFNEFIVLVRQSLRTAICEPERTVSVLLGHCDKWLFSHPLQFFYYELQLTVVQLWISKVGNVWPVC
jgi:hypothetical protein